MNENEKSTRPETTAEEVPYDPFANRNVKKPNSNVRSTANLIKASLGSGLMAGPLAFANAGWGIGLIGTAIVGILCGHCIHILVKTSRGCCRVEKKPLMDYAETCESAFSNGPKKVRPFAKTASIVAEFALVSTYIGVCCIYTVLISDTVKQLVERFIPSFVISAQYYSLITLPILVMLCQIRYLKFLAIFSMLANVLLVAVYVVCLYYIFREPISLENKVAIGPPARYPAFFSTVIFAMEGIGVVMPVENAMKTPRNFLGFPSVLVVAMSVIVFFYTTLGLFGYLRYGNLLRGTITLNLPTDHWPAIFAKGAIALSILFTYPLQFYVAYDIFNKYTKHRIPKKYKSITQFSTRTLGVCFCVAIGIALPLLEQIINLVGALFYSILGLLIPCIIETVFRWEDLGRYRWVLWKNIIIFIFGLMGLVSGCAVTISDIVRIIAKKTE